MIRSALQVLVLPQNLENYFPPNFPKNPIWIEFRANRAAVISGPAISSVYDQARSQDVAAGWPHTRRSGQKPEWGAKARRGAHLKNTVLDVCSNQGAKREMRGHRFQMGGLSTTALPLATALLWHNVLIHRAKVQIGVKIVIRAMRWGWPPLVRTINCASQSFQRGPVGFKVIYFMLCPRTDVC